MDPRLFMLVQRALVQNAPAFLVGQFVRGFSGASGQAGVLDILLAQYDQGREAFWESMRSIVNRYRAREPAAVAYVTQRVQNLQQNLSTPEELLTLAALDLVFRGMK